MSKCPLMILCAPLTRRQNSRRIRYCWIEAKMSVRARFLAFLRRSLILSILLLVALLALFLLVLPSAANK